jgi:hypothetical protein
MNPQSTYQSLIHQIASAVDDGRVTAIKKVRRQLVLTYWSVGKHIVE